jgi:hypothetical protein
MTRWFAALALIAALTAAFSSQSAQSFSLGYSRGVNLGLESRRGPSHRVSQQLRGDR